MSGNCSDEEVEALFALFEEPANEAALRQLIKQALDSAETDLSMQGRVDRISQRAEKNIFEAIQQESNIRFRRPTKVRKLILAAASIVLIFSVGIAFYINSRPAPEKLLEVVSEFGTDVKPGGNRATLHLDDGSIISLSEEKSGIVTGDSLTYSDGSLLSQAKGAAQNYTLNTPKGGQYSVVLPDGTQVWLNAESSLTYPARFDGDQRRVELTGEAYFEVSHHKKPFIVSSAKQEIKVLGTHFNINAYPDQEVSTTTLINGSVRVVNRETQSSSILSPGEQSRVQGGQIQIKEVDVMPYVSWRKGFFSFRETEMREAMSQLSRWYDVEVVYAKTMPPTHFFGDIARNENLASVLRILKQSGVNFRIEKDDSRTKLVVLP